MRNEIIERAGRALYGLAWKDMLAEDGGWSRRFIERVASGDIDPLPYVDAVILELILGRIQSFNKIIEDANETRRAKIVAKMRELGEIAEEIDKRRRLAA